MPPRYPPMKERPVEFELNHSAPLAQGLLWAGLGGGGCVGTMRFYDSSPARKHGTLVNMNAQTDWLWDSTLRRWVNRFNAASQKYITAATASTVPAGSPYALAVWIKSDDGGNYTGILSLFDRVTGGIIIESHQTQLRAYVNGQVFTVSGFADGTWHHGILQRIGDTGYGYVDGGNRTASFTHGSILGSFTPVAYDYGWFGAAGSYMYSGLAADPMIWARALTSAEIEAIADSSNVDLRVAGIPLILPPYRRSWPVATVEAATQIFARRQFGPRVGSRQLQV